MENRFQTSLDEIAKFIKEEDSKYATIQEVLDEIYGIGITAIHITSLIVDGFPILPDTIKDFKPSSFINKFMPRKYLNVTREDKAMERYKKLATVNLLITMASWHQAYYGKIEDINALYRLHLHSGSENVLNKIVDSDRVSKNLLNLQKNICELPSHTNYSFTSYMTMILGIQKEIFSEHLPAKDTNRLIDELLAASKVNYYVNLLDIISEFPEVKLWLDLSFQDQILTANKHLLERIEEVRQYQNKDFNHCFGFADLDEFICNSFNSKNIRDFLDQSILENIQIHHASIENAVRQRIREDINIDGLVLPTNEELYIPQSYQYFYYEDNKHKKNYLDIDNWESIAVNKGENIGKEVFQAINDPYGACLPIIILGHPGAGKSMFSMQFSNRLIKSNEFIPFLIKLRNVDSTIADIEEHIKQGIQKTIPGRPDINWVEWAKKFPSKTPVIILDGFDELLRASSIQLYDYILQIKKFQRDVQNANLSIRVILTSRLTMMQDVKIPEKCLIIKLDSFDDKRKKLWINKWNELLPHDKKFKLPEDRDDIDELAKEPLLLFLLAIYDFESGALSAINMNLDRSSLYDELFGEFTKRQLRKDNSYLAKNSDEQAEMEVLFRLRIGFFAQMLFLHDRIYHYERDFDEELNVFKLSDDKIKAKKILNNFFFIHKDQSTDGYDAENLSFEFLHRTFGEFLTADFMIRVSKYRAVDDEETFLLAKEEFFRQVFGFQWIYKQPKTLDFLFEHSKNILDETTSSIIIKMLKKELKKLADESATLSLPNTLHQLRNFEKLKHVAIYSQNLFLIWLSISKDVNFEFKLSSELDNVLQWRCFVDLWKNFGGIEYVAFLSDFIKVQIVDNIPVISKTNDINIRYTTYSNYSKIIQNHHEMILGYYESDFTYQDLIEMLDTESEELYLSVSNLLTTKIEYLHTLAPEKLDFEVISNLFSASSPDNQIKLLRFLHANDMHYDHVVELKNMLLCEAARHTGESYSEKLCFIELALEIDGNREAVKGVMQDLFNMPIEEKKSLSPARKLRFIELALEIDGNREAARGMMQDLFNMPIEEKKLTLDEKIRFVELVLEIKANRNHINNILESLIMELEYCGNRASISKKLRIVALMLDFKKDRRRAHDMLKEIAAASEGGRWLVLSEKKLLNSLFKEI